MTIEIVEIITVAALMLLMYFGRIAVQSFREAWREV